MRNVTFAYDIGDLVRHYLPDGGKVEGEIMALGFFRRRCGEDGVVAYQIRYSDPLSGDEWIMEKDLTCSV